jgi:hypothetical protein
MKKTKSLYHGHRFPAVVISCAVRWYFRFSLSLRDIEELLLERDVVLSRTKRSVAGATSSELDSHSPEVQEALTNVARHAINAVSEGRDRGAEFIVRLPLACSPSGASANVAERDGGLRHV